MKRNKPLMVGAAVGTAFGLALFASTSDPWWPPICGGLGLLLGLLARP